MVHNVGPSSISECQKLILNFMDVPKVTIFKFLSYKTGSNKIMKYKAEASRSSGDFKLMHCL